VRDVPGVEVLKYDRDMSDGIDDADETLLPRARPVDPVEDGGGGGGIIDFASST
jgi:hypothetical protein